MFPYQLKLEDKIFIITWYNEYPELFIYEVTGIKVVYNPLHENNGYTAVSLVNLITSFQTIIVFWNDIDLEQGEDGLNLFRTTNEQLAIKKFEEILRTNSSQETPKT